MMRQMIRRSWKMIVVLLMVLAGSVPASLDARAQTHSSAPSGAPLGITLVRGAPTPSPATSSGVGNLTYHQGGLVQAGTHQTYAIYWGSNTSLLYRFIINNYFANVAADSGKHSNVYAVATQYYEKTILGQIPVQYSEQFGGAWLDTSLPASGCTSTAGGPVCVSDAQVQAEVQKAITANGWPTGLGAEYFVFLANGVSTCAPGIDCAFTADGFCAYHSCFVPTFGGQHVLYANMPYAGHNLAACGSGNSPNGDAATDSTINIISHEALETITDPVANAWYDQTAPNPYEIGDKCLWNFGPQLGGAAGAQYNRVINGAHYELQQEYSNLVADCVLTN
jgi:hypothetical protein